MRLWNVDAGGRPALLLGPLAVACRAQRRGIGGKLVRRALREARRLGHGAVLLVGDPAYYERFGFQASMAAQLRVAGNPQQARLLAVTLRRRALTGAHGLVRAQGEKVRTDLPDFVVAPRYMRDTLPLAA